MIIDKTSWNLQDVKTVPREEFVKEQMKGKVYSQYSGKDREALFNMVYDYAVVSEVNTGDGK